MDALAGNAAGDIRHFQIPSLPRTWTLSDERRRRRSAGVGKLGAQALLPHGCMCACGPACLRRRMNACCQCACVRVIGPRRDERREDHRTRERGRICDPRVRSHRQLHVRLLHRRRHPHWPPRLGVGGEQPGTSQPCSQRGSLMAVCRRCVG